MSLMPIINRTKNDRFGIIIMIERLKETVEWYKDNPAWLTRE